MVVMPGGAAASDAVRDALDHADGLEIGHSRSTRIPCVWNAVRSPVRADPSRTPSADLSCHDRTWKQQHGGLIAGHQPSAGPGQVKIGLRSRLRPNRRSPHNGRRVCLAKDDQCNFGVFAVQLACTCAVTRLGKCTASVGAYPSARDRMIRSRTSGPLGGADLSL
jgi:hypothetical protein